MLDLQYFFARVGAKLGGDEAFSRFFRKNGIKVGKNCHIYSNILTPESFLITIGDNVTISNDVQLVTHDNSVCKLFPEKTDAFGEISIGDNCFIGAKSILLYGVGLPNNTIVAAGSVVTKSFAEEKLILGGNPARIIGRWEDFGKKIYPHTFNIDGLSAEEKRKLLVGNERLVRKE